MTEVSIDQFAGAQAAGAFVLDVREQFEYVQGHVPGATLVPLAEVPSQVSALPTDRPIFVICASGNRSRRAADFLVGGGLDARSVAGGTGGWISAGHPVVTGASPTEA